MSSTPTYRVSTVLSEPFVMNKTGGGGYEGFIVDLMDEVAAMAGFKYRLHLSSDGLYGGRESSGRWNGVIGELMRREADIAAADLGITSEREKVVDFTKPFMSQTLRVLMKKPLRLETSVGYVLQPFALEVWVCILFALVIVAILFMLIGRFDPYEWRQVPSDKDPRGARHSFGLRNSFMFVFSTLTLQGYRETPKSLAGRVLAVFWFIFVFLTVVAFIGNSVALSLSGPGDRIASVPFDGIEDLVDLKDMKVGMINGMNFQKLDNSSVPVYKRLATRIKSDPQSFVRTTAEGVQRVRASRGKFVMLMESAQAEYFVGRKPCSVMVHGPGLFSYGFGLATRTGMALRVQLSLAILELRERGTIQKLQQKWWNDRSKCMPAPDVAKSTISGTEITLKRAAAPFIILLVGAILSVLVLVGEVVFKKLRK